MESNDWIKHTTPHHLQIKDICNLPTGTNIPVLVLDRNVLDIAECQDTNEVNCTYPPSQFFRHNRATYIHKDELTGDIIFHWESKDSNKIIFEFHIEYDTGHWYPLENGHLPKNNPQDVSSFQNDKSKSWKEFDPNTRIGWRGPMILWENIDNLPRIYYSA